MIFSVDVRKMITHGQVFCRNHCHTRRDVLDVFLVLHKTVEKVDDQRFGDFLAEDSLETDVGEGVDKMRHGLLAFCVMRLVFCKDK
jgi:hypothetical protein